ncbi:MAG: PDZ domain-containing protein [Acidobacteriota bacterium]
MKKRTVTLFAALAGVALMAAGVSIAGGAKCNLSAAKSGKCCADLAKKYETQGWLGAELEYNEDGTYSITDVTHNSPAARAGFKADDVIEAINGTTLTPESAKRICSSHTEIGKTVAYGVRRDNDRLILSAQLVKIPETVLASMLEKHDKEHTAN